MRSSHAGRPAAPRALLAALALLVGASTAHAQSLSGPPGIDYYPSWMLRVDPYISGRDQDYDIWREDRFEPIDANLVVFHREQRRLYGPDYRERLGYQEDLQRWLEEHGRERAR